jgi:hypothetical protein
MLYLQRTLGGLSQLTNSEATRNQCGATEMNSYCFILKIHMARSAQVFNFRTDTLVVPVCFCKLGFKHADHLERSP